MSLKQILFTLVTFLCVFSATMGQPSNNYDKSWQRIDTLVQRDGLLKSALAEVNKIYQLAKKDNNDPQLIRALLYKLMLNDELSEQGKYENVELLEKEIATAKEPSKSILSSIAAGSYWHYLQLNRWKFYDRTATAGNKKADIATWSLEDLYERISTLFLGSLQHSDILKATALEKYDPIILKGNARYLRPTLYDLLAHRALDFFKNDERAVTKPAYAFEIDAPEAFASANNFAKHTFVTSDTQSLHHKAILIYQDLLRFHASDKNASAFIDANIQRLEFVYNFSTHPQKDSLYTVALGDLIKNNAGNVVVSAALYNLARQQVAMAQQYDPTGDSSGRYGYIRAEELCKRTLALPGDFPAKSQAQNLLKEIRGREIRTEAEVVNSVDQPFRVLLHFRNVTATHFRVIRIDKKTKEKIGIESWEEDFWKSALSLPAVKTFSVTLPDTKDRQMHRVEVKVDALPPGEYAILASTDPQFSLSENALAMQYLHVSDIAWINSNERFYIVNRNTGSALPGAEVTVWHNRYDYNAKKNITLKAGTYKTDKNGYVLLPENKQEGRNNYRVDVSFRKDRLFLDEYLYSYVYRPYEPDAGQKDKTFFFTDRAIYRPGQIAHFKGIVLTPRKGNAAAQIVVNRKSKVLLLDANQQPVDSLELTSNDFGSYSGRFTLPSHLLNGDFTIRDVLNNSQVNFRIEEYKRPRFLVEIPKPSGTFRLGDTVSVTGNATAFAGNIISGAAVKYRVVRRTIVPLWQHSSYMPRIWPPYPRSNVEIAHGAATTDDKGNFVVKFPALPDNRVPKSDNPVFHYEITADVTDITGETRSGSTSVAVGWQVLQLKIDLPEKMPVASFDSIRFRSVNMNDVFEKSNVTVKISPVNKPARDVRERYWQQPDLHIISREEYYRLFPYDEYADENNITKWPLQKEVLNRQVVTAEDTAYALKETKFVPGWYAVELTSTDKFGEPVKVTKYLQLTSGSENDKKKYIDNNEIATSRFYVKNNRIYIEPVEITDSLQLRTLDISIATFRNKTLPGSSETWSVNIRGNKGEQAAAELLTAMYDASLDQFLPHTWTAPAINTASRIWAQWNGHHNFSHQSSINRPFHEPVVEVKEIVYDRLKTTDEGGHRYETMSVALESRAPGVAVNGKARQTLDQKVQNFDAAAPVARESAIFNSDGEMNEESAADTAGQTPSVQPRKNLQETAFFFPHLRTDSLGNVSFSFTAPEALSEWKWMLLAHTKDLSFGYKQQTITTQKELMVQPNAPRFLREGDRLDFTASVVNMTDRELSGRAALELYDPSTGEKIDGVFQNAEAIQHFTAAAGQPTAVRFSISIPYNFVRPVNWRVIASSGNLSDGEEALLPVISNRMLVTESLPITVKGNANKKFRFEKLLSSAASPSLTHHALTVEYTSNPAWFAIQSLPYLAEGKKENTEQIFNRYYANAIAAHIIKSSPRFQEIIKRWKTTDTTALMSQLEKNEELKNIILQETPWVMDAKSDAERKRNLALLFDVERMSGNLTAALEELRRLQAPGGGFVWLPGFPEDRYMTQYIITGMGRLRELGALPQDPRLKVMLQAGVAFLDQQIRNDYDNLKKNNKKLPMSYLPDLPVQYLYMRSYFKEMNIPGAVNEAYNYFRERSRSNWVDKNSYLRAMIAISHSRTGDAQTASKILAALNETAIRHSELGMYWKDMSGGYYWHQAPIEAQAVLIEAFTLISKNVSAVDNMKTWLLKNKQTNNWKTTRATADACYALLLRGSDWTGATPSVKIALGNQTVSSSDADTEAGTGYFKSRIDVADIKPALGNIDVRTSSVATGASSWGAVYWQYFEDLEKITPSTSTPLKIEKKLFVETNTDRGPVLKALEDNAVLQPGDKIKVRIEIRSDRDLEYVHLKDMRASCMEPVNVLSSYKWSAGLGYYESTKDVSTDFFFQYVPKGVHIFEYPLYVTQTGTFSNGVTTIQCMYAPEFNSHSEGIKVTVNKK